ncbi:MAG: corrinoid protein, partial [Lachnospiraceae bacterium]|nr:corrinoid protein [Lachnospiraceae bacterium]
TPAPSSPSASDIAVSSGAAGPVSPASDLTGPVQADAGAALQKAVIAGLPDEVRAQTRLLLEQKQAMEIIEQDLIPALDIVGERYEKQLLFLPQLINAANAASAGFDLIKDRIAQTGEGSVSKGEIILATVEGDIHDIGKNIVKVVLENYGFTVYDLGRDVPPETVRDAAKAHDIRLVGLSALMTTTLPAMEKTIRVLRESGLDCKVVVGGAVVTQEYADEIGADCYARDARDTVEYARNLFGQN